MPVTIANTGVFNVLGGASPASALGSAAGLTAAAAVQAFDAGNLTALNPSAGAAALNAAGAGNPVIRGLPWYYNSGTSGVGSTFAVTKDPGVQPGDVLLIFMTWNGTGTTPTATGFTSYTKTTNSLGIALFSRVADGTEGGTFTVTLASGFNVAAVCVAYQNTNGLLDPVPANSGTITLATTTIPGASITTTKNNDVLIWFGAVRANGAGAAVPTISVPSALQAEGSQTATSASASANMSVLMADGPGGSFGATGALTGTSSLSDNVGGILLAVESSATVPLVNASAGLAAASAWAAVNAVSSNVNVFAGLAAATGTAQAATPTTSGLSTILGAYIDETQYGGSLTHAQAISHWSSNSGRLLAAERQYFGINNMSTTVTANQLAAFAAGRVLLLSYKPSYYGTGSSGQPLTGSATSQAACDSTVNTFLSNLVTALTNAGLTQANCPIDLWQEPYYTGVNHGGSISAANFIAMFQHYSPIVRSHGFQVGFCTSAGSVWANSENTYYPGDAYTDFCVTDYYFPQYQSPPGSGGSPQHRLGPLGATATLATDPAYPADNASPPKPFGIYEFNSSTDATQGCTKAEGQAFWGYILTYFQDRITAGMPVWPVCVFNSDSGSANPRDSAIVVADGVVDPYGGGTATEYRNALVAALVDGLA